MILNLNAVNQANKNTFIYTKNEPITSISLVLKGRVMIYNDGVKTIVGSGNFIGISDLNQGEYRSNYVAYDDVMVYTFDVHTMDNVGIILNTNKDYRGLVVCSLDKYIAEIAKGYVELCQGADSIYHFWKGMYEKFTKVNEKVEAMTKNILDMSKMNWYESRQIVDERKLQYHIELAKIPVEAYKDFYVFSEEASLYQIEEQAELINKLMEECFELVNYIAEVFHSIIYSGEECLYKIIAKTAIKIGSDHAEYNGLVSMVDETIEEVIVVENMFEQYVGRKLVVDRTEMEEIYYQLLTGSGTEKTNKKKTEVYKEDEITQLLKHSTKQILEYSGLDEVFCKETKELIDEFYCVKDRLSIEETVRVLRKKITQKFYVLYYEVFQKAYREKTCPRIIDMFLKYGYLDERLLSLQQQIELYRLEENTNQEKACQVYNIKEWLIAIFEGRKEPSKNEFDIDYRTMVRTQKNKNEITPEQEKENYDNQQMKLEFEVKNMFQYNHRIANGRVSIFMPILYEEMFINSVIKAYVTAEKINNEIKKILEVDYSLFYREIMYSDESQGIKREFVMREVFPDIILMPTNGANGIMWQDISDKRRGNSGRFILPIFAEGDLYEMLLKTCGRFRWELCRTLQGMSWNDLLVKSLTSEYSSYLQFYRKNKDISEEKKEKIKIQIQKARNSSREVFTMDYETWIKYEVLGSVRLNKTVREILSTYCPFAKEKREKLSSQPMFEVAMVRFLREAKKKTREMELRLYALQKEKVTIPQELLDTKEYYQER